MYKKGRHLSIAQAAVNNPFIGDDPGFSNPFERYELKEKKIHTAYPWASKHV